jgi:hypothetical protein
MNEKVEMNKEKWREVKKLEKGEEGGEEKRRRRR